MFLSMKIIFTLTNIAEPAEMPNFVAFHLGLHCLPKYAFGSLQLYKGLKRDKHILLYFAFINFNLLEPSIFSGTINFWQVMYLFRRVTGSFLVYCHDSFQIIIMLCWKCKILFFID